MSSAVKGVRIVKLPLTPIDFITSRINELDRRPRLAVRFAFITAKWFMPFRRIEMGTQYAESHRNPERPS